MNMHLWAEQHSWLCGWIPNEMWKMSLPQCIALLVLTLFWVEWGIGCVLNDRSLHQSGHLVSAPSISMPRSSNLEKARAIGQVEAGVPPESSCGIIWSEPWYHLQTTVAEKYNLSHVQHFSATIDISLLRLAFLCYDWHFSATIGISLLRFKNSLLRLIFLCYDWYFSATIQKFSATIQNFSATVDRPISLLRLIFLRSDRHFSASATISWISGVAT